MKELVKILIVDDSPVVCRQLTEVFARREEIAIVGTTGRLAEAKRLISQFKPQIITLDLQLEDGNGIELLREIKATREAGAAPSKVLILSSYSGLSFREKCQQFGADLFLDKATEFENVESAVFRLANAAE